MARSIISSYIIVNIHWNTCSKFFYWVYFTLVQLEKEAQPTMTAPETAAGRVAAPLPPKRIVVFDMGQVFVKFTPQTHNLELLAHCNVPQEALVQFFHGIPWAEYECGRITSRQLHEQAIADLGYQLDYEGFRRDMCLTLELDAEMFDFLNDLKVRVKNTQIQLWMLSNLNEIHYEYVARRWPGLFSSFLHVFISYQIGHRKPDREIFEHILKVGGAKPEECVFVDDMEINGKGAEAMGIRFIQFSNLAELRAALVKYGIYR